MQPYLKNREVPDLPALFEDSDTIKRDKKLTVEQIAYLLESQDCIPEIMISLDNGDTFMHELLLSFKCQKLLKELQLTVGEILQNVREKGLTFQVLKTNIILARETIKSGGAASINVEPEDIIHGDFITLFESIPPSERGMIMVEFIESQYIDNSPETVALLVLNIKKIQNLGYLIAIDDWYNEDLEYEDTNNRSYKNLTLLLENGICPDVIKIEGQVIQDLYNGIHSSNIEVQDESWKEVQKIKQALLNLRNKLKKDYGKEIFVIGERINGTGMGQFTKQNIGVEYGQGRDLKQQDFQK